MLVKSIDRWFKNGDHPKDNCRTICPVPGEGAPFLSEGIVVRYYRNPYLEGDKICDSCGDKIHHHGWIDAGPAGIKVCPGSFIVTTDARKDSPLKYLAFSSISRINKGDEIPEDIIRSITHPRQKDFTLEISELNADLMR